MRRRALLIGIAVLAVGLAMPYAKVLAAPAPDKTVTLEISGMT